MNVFVGLFISAPYRVPAIPQARSGAGRGVVLRGTSGVGGAPERRPKAWHQRLRAQSGLPRVSGPLPDGKAGIYQPLTCWPLLLTLELVC